MAHEEQRAQAKRDAATIRTTPARGKDTVIAHPFADQDKPTPKTTRKKDTGSSSVPEGGVLVSTTEPEDT